MNDSAVTICFNGHQLQNVSVQIALALILLLGSLSAEGATITLHSGCSLVQAITAANTDSYVGGCAVASGADTIVLVADVDLTTIDNIVTSLGGNGLPVITSDITIRGGDYSIARMSSSLFRIFYVSSSGSLMLQQVIVEDGESDGIAGCIYVEENGSLALDRSAVQNCTAHRSGGIQNAHGTVIIDRSYFAGNIASAPAGENAYGGAISSFGGDLTIRSSTFYGNAVFDFSPGDGGDADGGAVRITGGTAVIENSTFSSNMVAGNAGAVTVSDLWFIPPPPVVRIAHSTFFSNQASDDNSSIRRLGGQVTLTGNIVLPAVESSCNGIFVDGGNNFGCFGEPVVTGFDTTLQDNGGPTPTHALLVDSNSIEAVIPCQTDLDQRGFVRDNNCDSGAYEYTDCFEEQLRDDTILSFEIFQANCSLKVGPNWTVGSSGNVTLRAGRRVVLNEGFKVKRFGQLNVEIDPALLIP